MFLAYTKVIVVQNGSEMEMLSEISNSQAVIIVRLYSHALGETRPEQSPLSEASRASLLFKILFCAVAC